MFVNNFGRYKNVECGLAFQPPRRIGEAERPLMPVSLTSVFVNATVIHAVAQVEISQTYSNNEKDEESIEAIYFFPVDSNGAVTHFNVQLDGRTIHGVVKSNEEAKAQYEKAVIREQSSFLGEENKPDIFKVSIGNVKQGAEVKVVIGYVTEVSSDPDTHAIRFFIPTTIAPKYIPTAPSNQNGEEINRNVELDNCSSVPLTIKVITSIQGEIKSIESASHNIIVESNGSIADKPGWNKSIVILNGETREMDRDFVLLITPMEPLKPRLYSEVFENGSTALMTHLIPNFKLEDQKVELIIVLDRSSSMAGNNILMAQKALLLFLHSMPADCFFNLVGFGSSYHFLFRTGSAVYNGKHLLYATRYTEGLEADLGGTEILQPLTEIYATPPISGYLRQIFVITDGQVSNTESVIALIKKNAHQSRVFALGIGQSTSHHLVEGMASAGGGTCAFVESDENIQKRTLGQLKNALKPSMTDVKVEWKGVEHTIAPVISKWKNVLGLISKSGGSVETESTPLPYFFQSPRKIPPIHDGSQMIVFGVFDKEKPTGVKITAQSPDGPLTIDIELSNKNEVGLTKMLHLLSAVKAVRELELEEVALGLTVGKSLSGAAIKAKIIEIAEKNGIASKYTAFVTVDKTSNSSVDNHWAMQRRYILSQLPQGSHERFSQSRRKKSVTTNPPPVVVLEAGAFNRNKRRDSDYAAFGFSPPPVTSEGSLPSSRRTTPPSRRTTPPSRKPTPPSGPPPTTLDLLHPPNLPQVTEIPSNIGASSFQKDNLGDEPIIINLALVHTLISLQSFVGSFPLNQTLVDIFGVNIDIVKAEALKNGWDETGLATALALVFLSDKMSEWKEFWELVAIKAQKWMEQNHTQVKESMMSTASIIVNSN